MLFKRRQAPTISERVRVWLWPRRSWSRSLRYIFFRIVRLRTNPHALALGCAAGVFVSCTPLIGGHIVLAALLANALRANVPAAMLATFFGNPLSWPAIWAATYFAGTHLIGEGQTASLVDLGSKLGVVWEAVLLRSPELSAAAAAIVWPIFKPMLAGSLPIGFAAGILIYCLTRLAAIAVNKRKFSRSPAQVADYEEPSLART